MSASDDVIRALALPADCRVDQRVAKKLIMDQGLPTPADKKHIQEGIEGIVWVAALKPNRIGVQPLVDEIRAYREIVVLRATLRPKAKPPRLIEILHRVVPHPVLLVVEQEGQVSVSAAHKRHSQAEKGATVLEGSPATVGLQEAAGGFDGEFLGTLAVSSLPSANLYAMVQGWVDRIEALRAARITGLLLLPGDQARGSHRAGMLALWEQLQTELAVLRRKARSERQINRRVALNLEIRKLEAQATELRERL
jgi:hypothetical protein